MKLNAMLTKNQFICRGMMNVSSTLVLENAGRSCASGVHPVMQRLRAPRLLRGSAQEAD
jgi:hypothetical protein